MNNIVRLGVTMDKLAQTNVKVSLLILPVQKLFSSARRVIFEDN